MRRADRAASGSDESGSDESDGTAPPVLFVHGAWHGAWCWAEHFAEWFSEHGFTTYAVDLRGHGDSPGNLRRTRIAHYVSDVRRVAIEFDEPPIVVGHSMGGFVTQHYIERYPVAAAVLLAPVPAHGAIGATLRVARRHPVAFARANASWSLWPIVDDPDRAARLLFGPTTDPARARAHSERLAAESYPAYVEMILDLPTPRGDVPMLVVGGAHDALFRPAELSRTAAAHGADLTILDDLGHDLMLEDGWEAAAEVITRWLAGRWPV